MEVILFQGDSITDMNRSRNFDSDMGIGYPTLVAGELGLNLPGKFKFLNRGVSGNRVIDLLGRVKIDTINLKPNYLSILIGVNDVWHELSKQNGVDAETYEMYYNLLIKQIKTALPNIKIMILEPFLLKGSATEENWEVFRSEVEKRAAAAQRVAKLNNLIFVELMKKFDELAPLAPTGYWLTDGVHPTAMGHEVIKNEWVKAFKKLKAE